MYGFLFCLILIIPVAGYLIERYLEYLNSTTWSDKLPEQLKGICDEEEYRRSQQYQKDNRKLALWSSTLNLVLVLLMIISGGFALVDSIARSISSNYIIISLTFFGILGLASWIIGLPFTIYDTFVIERKYGFNLTSRKTFITDLGKSMLVAVILGGPLLALITWFYHAAGNLFWLYAWILITVFSLAVSFFWSDLIVPLFNKQTPLEQGELRNGIEEFAASTGFRLKDIYVIDGSKRSTKANAYFSGFGSRKRIVLYDTLLSELTNGEIIAVLAHETGHYRKKHILKALVLSVIMTGLMLFLFSLVAGSSRLPAVLGAENYGFHLALLVFGILYSPVSVLTGVLTNFLSRKKEYEADEFVKENYDPSLLASALKKLSVKNLSDMMPHPAYVFFYYSHPPLLRRLENLE